MTYFSILIASAGMALGIVGPDTDPDCAGGCSDKANAACPLRAAHGGEKPGADAALYEQADWPAHNPKDNLYFKDLQGARLPVALGEETWLSDEVDLKNKVLVLDFWATWCPPCIAAMPMLNELQEANREHLAVLSISGQNENLDTVRSYLENHEESVSNLFDAKQHVYREFESEGIPLVVIISTDGVIRWIGNPHEAGFKPALARVLKVDPIVSRKS